MTVERLPRDPGLFTERAAARVALASRSFAAVIFGLRPPTRPRARADASPARVRSVINSRSNSASAKMPKTSLPAAVVVSIAAPWPVATRRPIPPAVRSCTVLTRWRRLRPSQLPHHERVAFAQRL